MWHFLFCIFLYNLLFFIYVSVSRNMIFLLYFSNLNLIVGCFVLSSSRNFVRSFSLLVQKKKCVVNEILNGLVTAF